MNTATLVHQRRHRLLVAVVPLALTLAAWAYLFTGMGDYGYTLIILIAINALMATSFNVVLGRAGQLSLAQAGVMGAGAYATGLLIVRGGYAPWPALVAAVLVGMVFAALTALPVLHLKGLYFAITTFAAGELVVIYLGIDEALTGGGMGLTGIAPLSPVHLGGRTLLDPLFPRDMAIVTSLALMLVTVLVALLARLRVGATWTATKDDETLAASLGVTPYRAKLTAIIVSGGIAGLAGGLYATYLQYLQPSQFDSWQSIMFLSMAVVGGLGRTYGPLAGAALLTLLSEWLRDLHLNDAAFILSGLALIAIVLVAPRGIVGELARAVPRLRPGASPREEVRPR
ncbi:branched-chain amino acid ABC transporter permease [Acrocarpospora catenulata]|uniref:branched-chain amino acid ABC transporter permease n=1 Tax=Acrocarpospora catenulata TaxID=2836182 RepID=UPI001BD94CFC|nr:branched-chain amino acid ABC transporter permease [Acrocarpospora catenulata]